MYKKIKKRKDTRSSFLLLLLLYLIQSLFFFPLLCAAFTRLFVPFLPRYLAKAFAAPAYVVEDGVNPMIYDLLLLLLRNIIPYQLSLLWIPLAYKYCMDDRTTLWPKKTSGKPLFMGLFWGACLFFFLWALFSEVLKFNRYFFWPSWIPDWIKNYANQVSASLGKQLYNESKGESVKEEAILNWKGSAFVISSATLLPGILEELFFRWGIQRVCVRSVKNRILGLFIASFLFSAFHCHIPGLIYRTLLGIWLGWVYLQSGNLLYPMLFHALNNGLGYYIFSITVSLRSSLYGYHFDEQTFKMDAIDWPFVLWASGCMLMAAYMFKESQKKVASK